MDFRHDNGVDTQLHFGLGKIKINVGYSSRCGQKTMAMFTLIGFCSVAKVASVQCEQELMGCCGAENVPKRSQCEQKPYPSYNLQRPLLI